MKKTIPTVETWCLPEGLDEKELLKLHQGIVAEMASYMETGVKDENDMLNLFPKDHMTYGLGSEIKVEITDLPQVSGNIVYALAADVGMFVKTMFPQANVYCKAECFNPEAGAWSSN